MDLDLLLKFIMMEEAEGRPSFIARTMKYYGLTLTDNMYDEVQDDSGVLSNQLGDNKSWWNFDTVIFPLGIVFGIILGISIPGNPSLSVNYRTISGILGWVYFFSWTFSFYPQVYLNYVRKSSVGLASDKILYDVLGFSCLSVYSIAFYWIPSVRQLYADRNDGHEPKVEINDVCFALHALFLTFVQIAQMAYYDGKRQLPSRFAVFWVCLVVTIVLIYLVIAVVRHDNTSVFNILDWFYFVSFVKMGVTLVKYIPQVILNYRRKSTVGWNITGCIMDITGAILSLLQLLLDCNDTHDWGGVTGDLVKLGLGAVSMLFDIIFITQHYYLYPQSGQYKSLDVDESLIDDREYARTAKLEDDLLSRAHKSGIQ